MGNIEFKKCTESGHQAYDQTFYDKKNEIGMCSKCMIEKEYDKKDLIEIYEAFAELAP